MKKNGVLNAELSRIIATMGHSDRLVICDSGLPIPRSAGEVVDLALTRNIPRFHDTLRVVLEEAEIEQAIVATEIQSANPAVYKEASKLLSGVKMTSVPHEEFKQMLGNGGTIAFVRTGEATPYANIILVAGVTFD